MDNIRIWVGDEIVRGRIVFDSLGASLISQSGKLLERNRQDVFYAFDYEILIDENGKQVCAQLHKPVIIKYAPRIVITRPYNRTATELSGDIHPPSSKGWYGRMIRGKENALYIIQELKDKDLFWITVLDSDSNAILESHIVERYEIEVLQLLDSFEHFNIRMRLFDQDTRRETRKRIMKILDETTLSWEEIYTLSEGYILPTSRRGRNSRETLSTMFPINAYPEDVREEILAFLTWTVKETIPERNLVRFVDSLEGMPTFRALMVYHLRMLVDNEPIPPYLRMASYAAQGLYRYSPFVQEMQSQKPDVILRYKVLEMAPNWQAEAIQVAKSLDSKEISLVLPKSKRTRSTERGRFLMSTMGFSLRTHIQPMNIGLQNVVYLSNDYRWVHRHLSYSYSLHFGIEPKSPLYLQSMIVPPLTDERIKSILPYALNVGWDSASTNYNLFREKQGRWTMKLKRIQDSIENSATLEVLRNKFGGRHLESPYHLNRKEAKIIDMVNSGVFYLTHLDLEKGRRYWNTTKTKAERILTDLRNKGVVEISYRFPVSGKLTSVTLIVEGQPKSVYSVSKALLESCPTTRTLISKDGTLSINTSRIPVDYKDEILNYLPQVAKEKGITIKPYTVTGFRNYEGSLYQRIIKEDGTYDDDVSGFLSQIITNP
ncbi:MAG: hypothetical protein ACFFF4_01545 [Candidatus Thorarchaeota archaeon]